MLHLNQPLPLADEGPEARGANVTQRAKVRASVLTCCPVSFHFLSSPDALEYLDQYHSLTQSLETEKNHIS